MFLDANSGRSDIFVADLPPNDNVRTPLGVAYSLLAAPLFMVLWLLGSTSSSLRNPPAVYKPEAETGCTSTAPPSPIRIRHSGYRPDLPALPLIGSVLFVLPSISGQVRLHDGLNRHVGYRAHMRDQSFQVPPLPCTQA